MSEWLSAEQRAQFEQHRYFDVIGCDSGKRYRIHYGTAANVHEVDDAGNATMGWCFVPSGFLVPGDVMLAQKIALETDEKGPWRSPTGFRRQRILSIFTGGRSSGARAGTAAQCVVR